MQMYQNKKLIIIAIFLLCSSSVSASSEDRCCLQPVLHKLFMNFMEMLANDTFNKCSSDRKTFKSIDVAQSRVSHQSKVHAPVAVNRTSQETIAACWEDIKTHEDAQKLLEQHSKLCSLETALLSEENRNLLEAFVIDDIDKELQRYGKAKAARVSKKSNQLARDDINLKEPYARN